MAEKPTSVAEELVMIRKLLIVAVLNMPGMTQAKLAKSLGINQSTISRMFSTKS